jgi:predicted DNA-binding transcriptional regulator AlpA
MNARSEPPPPDERRYVDLKTFRRMFGFSKSFVYRKVKDGTFTKLKQGSRTRFSVAEGEAYYR